jgi:hypothetical protein
VAQKKGHRPILRRPKPDGYHDGRTGKEPACPEDPAYMAEHRRGTKALNLSRNKRVGTGDFSVSVFGGRT